MNYVIELVVELFKSCCCFKTSDSSNAAASDIDPLVVEATTNTASEAELVLRCKERILWADISSKVREIVKIGHPQQVANINTDLLIEHPTYVRQCLNSSIDPVIKPIIKNILMSLGATDKTLTLENLLDAILKAECLTESGNIQKGGCAQMIAAYSEVVDSLSKLKPLAQMNCHFSSPTSELPAAIEPNITTANEAAGTGIAAYNGGFRGQVTRPSLHHGISPTRI